MARMGYDEWWYSFCEKRGFDNSKRGGMIRDIWDEWQAEVEDVKREMVLGGSEFEAMKLENGNLKNRLVVVEDGREKLEAKVARLEKENKRLMERPDKEDDADRAKMASMNPGFIVSGVPTPVPVKAPSYESLSSMLGTIWLEYLVRGLGFGCGLALVLAFFRLLFKTGVC